MEIFIQHQDCNGNYSFQMDDGSCASFTIEGPLSQPQKKTLNRVLLFVCFSPSSSRRKPTRYHHHHPFNNSTTTTTHLTQIFIMSNQTRMDLSIAERRAYEFLLRSEEAKRWIEEMTQERFGHGSSIAYFGEMLRDGVALAKLAKIFAPTHVKKINKPNQNTIKLEFSLVDNITQFLNACKSTGFREIYLFGKFLMVL